MISGNIAGNEGKTFHFVQFRIPKIFHFVQFNVLKIFHFVQFRIPKIFHFVQFEGEKYYHYAVSYAKNYRRRFDIFEKNIYFCETIIMIKDYGKTV